MLAIEAKGAFIEEILDPVEAKYLSASAASSRSTFEVVPVLVV